MSSVPPPPPDFVSADDAAAAGLFDFQVNGFGGVDFQSEDLTAAQLQQALRCLGAHGVAAIFATLITDGIDALCRKLERLEQLCARDPAARACIVGYHLEGPWLRPEPGYCGAHPAEAMRAPAYTDFQRLQNAARGRIRLVTLAPEWPGCPEFISALTADRVHVALGHTDASEQEIDRAIAAGARFATHLGNGVPSILPRHDNIIQRLLARDELYACFIPDGVHLPAHVLRNFVRAKPADRVLFTTDAMAGAGAPPGTYRLGRMEVQIGADGIARQPGNTGFAGSTLTPDTGIAHVAAWLDLPRSVARRLWSDIPAHVFGVTLAASPLS